VYGGTCGGDLLAVVLGVEYQVGSYLGVRRSNVPWGSGAREIGWPPGNPFQTEVAIANLAAGTLGILYFWIRGNF
jgi:hypothetical protein